MSEKENPNLDLKALQHLEGVRSGDFDRSHKTCAEIDAKSRIIILAYVAFLTTFVSYQFGTFSEAALTQKAFVIGLIPPLFISSWLFSNSLMSKNYVEGMAVDSFENLINLEAYYKARILFLNDALADNCEANSEKSKALGRAIKMLLASVLISTFATIAAIFFNYIFAESSAVSILIGVLLISIFLTFIATHNLIQSTKESLSDQDNTIEQNS